MRHRREPLVHPRQVKKAKRSQGHFHPHQRFPDRQKPESSGMAPSRGFLLVSSPCEAFVRAMIIAALTTRRVMLQLQLIKVIMFNWSSDNCTHWLPRPCLWYLDSRSTTACAVPVLPKLSWSTKTSWQAFLLLASN